MKSSKNYQVHPTALCQTEDVGPGTTIWAFTHILPGAKIGREVNLCDHVFVEGKVQIGHRTTVKCFVALWDGVILGEDVFVGPGVVFANDKYPRSKKHLLAHAETIVGKGASIGAGAVILPGVAIGAYAMVAAGAVVTKDVQPFESVRGNPARHAAFVCKCGFPLKRIKKQWQCVRSGWKGFRPSPEMECDR